MSQWDKLLWRILHLSNNLRFDEIRKVLEHFGFAMEGKSHGGSHRTFRKKAECRLRSLKKALSKSITSEKSKKSWI